MNMGKREEKQAKNLERLLRKGGTCHDPALVALQKTSNSLLRLSETADEEMNPQTMAKQRALLMSKSKELQTEKTSLFSRLKQSGGRLVRSWKAAIAPIGAAALVIAVIVMLILPKDTILHPQGGAIRRITDLVIPAAMAADAFAFQAETEDAGGASTSTAFIIHSKMDLSEDALSSHLVIVPSRKNADTNPEAEIAVRVEKKDAETFRVIPQSPLDPGTAYRVEIRAAVQTDGGELQARTFSWAIQTKDVFRVLSSVPSDAANTVPVNTVIEVTVSMDRWSDPASHFRITPEVKGRFQTKGRTITFIPDQPLAYGTVYTTTWNKDWGLKDSDVNLGSDYVARFETVSKVRAEAEAKKYEWVRSGYPYIGTAPGKNLRIPVYIYGSDRRPEIRIEGYALSRERASSYLAEETKRPFFGVAAREYGALEASYAKTLAFTASSTIQAMNWVDSISIPNTVDQGFYLLKLSVADRPDAPGSWVFLNVANEAAYLMADKDQMIVWVMHATEERPLEGITVSDGVQTVRTDKDGVARLKTPSSLANKNDDTSSTIISVGDGVSGTLLPLSNSMELRSSYWWYDSSAENAANRTVSYLHLDRPLYRPTDRVEFAGLIQDRESGKNPSEPITVSLMRSCTPWYCDEEHGDAKLFERTTVSPDDRGFFKGGLSWESIGEGAYVIVLRRGDKVVRSEQIEIRNFVKPDYTVETSVEHDEVFAGEKIVGSAQAQFFDGTPMASLKLGIDTNSGHSEQTTDEDGKIGYTFDTQAPNCDIERNPRAECNEMTNFPINVAPTESESVSNIFDRSTVWVWNTDIDLVPDWNTTFNGNSATVGVRANQIVLPSTDGEPRKTIPNLQVHAVVLEHWWERVQTGTGYNEIEKTTYPTYRYDEHEETVATLDQTTDAKGKASFTFQTKTDRTYTVVMYAKDSKGRWSVSRDWIYPPCAGCTQNTSLSGSDGGMTYLSFGPTETRRQDWSYHVNEKVSLSVKGGEYLLPRTSAPTYLYITSHLGIKDVKASVDPTIEFPFLESYAPNATVNAIVFRKGGFREYSSGIFMNTEDRKLTVDISTDNQTYTPGSDATIRVKVQDPSGAPKEGVRVSFAVVDEALFRATNGIVNENALQALYEFVDSGVLFSAKTHRSDEDLFGGGGGAERGGGGGEMIRKNFKDTAAYEVVTTNRNGEGEVNIKLPDNLTTWRVSGVAISADRYAGSARSSIVVTKKVFVNAVLPETFLESDRPQMKLRTYGTALKTGDEVAYTVDAPSLGIHRQEIKSKAGESALIGIDHPVVGTHTMTIRVKTAAGTDAIEKSVTIVSSRFEREEGVLTEATTETTIDNGGAWDTLLSFVPKTRAQYLPKLHQLRWNWSQRVEGKIAEQVAGELLRTQFGEEVKGIEPTLFMNYQKPDGGIAILPHASSDVALSSRVAYTYPQGFDRADLAEYFRMQLKAPDAPREVQIEAIAGLAAIGEPALLDLRSVAALKDLTWREKLSIMRGMVAIGDLEAARPFLNEFLDGKEVRDDILTADVSNQDAEDQEATVQLAAIAIRLGDSRATALRNGVKKIWDSGVYAPLAEADFLKVAVPAAVGNIAAVTYEINGKKTKIELAEGWPETVHLAGKEAKSFKMIEVTGPVELTYLRRVTTKPQQDNRLKLTRTYVQGANSSSNDFKDGGGAITVQLVPEFAPDAPKGCYTVQDHIPAGFSAMTGWNWESWQTGLSYVSPFEAESPTFVVCTDWGNKLIRYQMKPTARGTYLAEPAVIQSMDHPAATALSGEQQVIIQ
jgi:hypothetical protein